MASTPAINLRKGHAVRHNNDVCVVISHELKTPPRMASYVVMSIRSVTNKKVSNLHMTSNASDRIKSGEFRQLREFVGSLGGEIPVVVIGDFNTDPKHPEFQKLLSELRGKPS